MGSALTYEMLRDAVEGGSVALRSLLKLQPVDGPGGKIFPPTYPEGDKAVYAFEKRVSARGTDDEVTQTVLIDSVASQANRAEQALLRAWEEQRLAFPVPYVDFSGTDELSDLGRITVLEAPHRLADAIFRDSLFEGELFRLSDVGKEVFKATPRNATVLYQHAPTALLFGQWDSTGPTGRGAKFQRVYVSEIAGYGAQLGVKTSSRIDPLEIPKGVPPIYKHKDFEEQWTMNESEAVKEKGKPVHYKKGNPSNINHGNIKPSIDDSAGGVTISEAQQTTVISLAGLRRLRFADQDRQNEIVARTAIAALGVTAMALGLDADFDLRSRCLLVPVESQTIQLVARDGSDDSSVSIDSAIAKKVFDEACEAADKSNIGWSKESLIMKPSDKLIGLLAESRKVAVSESEED